MGCKLHSEMPQNDDLENYKIIDYNKVEYITMKEEVKQTDSVELFITGQLDKFEIKLDDLQKLVDQYSILKVESIDDKVGRKAVSEARKNLKSKRALITNKGKELRDVPNKVSKAIIAREKELISITQPEEDRLEQIEKDISEEEEELARIKAFEEQELIIARTKLLEGYGATFNGVQYQLGEHTITVSEVRLFTEIEFSRVEYYFRDDFENFERLRLQVEIDRQASLIKYKTEVEEYLLSKGFKYEIVSGLYFSEDLNYRFKFNTHLESEEEVLTLKENLSLFLIKKIKEKLDSEAKRIANEELKVEQERLAEIDKQQKAQQADLDRKQKALDDQLAEIELQNKKAVEISNQLEIIKQQEIQTKKDLLAEESRKIEMAPDLEILKQIAVDIKGSIVNYKMKSAKGSAVINNINELKRKTINYIEEQIKSL